MAMQCTTILISITLNTNTSMLDMIFLPFMQRALLGGLIVAVLLGWLGVFVTSRKMSFVGAGVAHASLGSIALAILLGLPPLPIALVLGVVFAIFLYYAEKNTDLSQDILIGILFAAGMAVGIILLSLKQGYTPELTSFLFGNILSVTSTDLWIAGVLGVTMVTILALFRREFTFTTIDAVGAKIAGVRTTIIDLSLYILTAVAVVLSLNLVGIVLVSALLVLPSAIAKPFSRTFVHYQFYAIVASLVFVTFGLVLSYLFNLPSGATIIMVGTFIFMFATIISSLVKK